MLRRFGTKPASSMLVTISTSSMVTRACSTDDVLLDHHAAHVVGAVRKTQLPDLAALRHPGSLQVVEVVEHDSRRGERPQVIDARGLDAASFRVLGLIAP